MSKKANVLKLIIAIIIPLAVGVLSSFITKDAMISFNAMKKPPLAPPGILFPIVWSILYVLMGISSCIIYEFNVKIDTVKSRIKNDCLVLYVIQLVFNFFWSSLFFRFKLYYFALAWLVVLWILVFALILKCMKINKIASYLLIPYILWMTFAAYLNISITLLY